MTAQNAHLKKNFNHSSLHSINRITPCTSQFPGWGILKMYMHVKF